jgi:hypothetical protein
METLIFNTPRSPASPPLASRHPTRDLQRPGRRLPASTRNRRPASSPLTSPPQSLSLPIAALARAKTGRWKRADEDGGATKHPVEVIGRIRNLASGVSSALEFAWGGTAVRVRGDAGGCHDFILDGVSVSEEDLEGFYRRFVRSRIHGVPDALGNLHPPHRDDLGRPSSAPTRQPPARSPRREPCQPPARSPRRHARISAGRALRTRPSRVELHVSPPAFPAHSTSRLSCRPPSASVAREPRISTDPPAIMPVFPRKTNTPSTPPHRRPCWVLLLLGCAC